MEYRIVHEIRDLGVWLTVTFVLTVIAISAGVWMTLAAVEEIPPCR